MVKTAGIFLMLLFMVFVRQNLAQTPPPSPTPCDILSITPTDTITPSATLIPSPTPTDIPDIELSEVMVDPVSGESEWVEIFNNSSNISHLNNWQIDDIENGGSSPKTFSTDIAGHSYAVIDLTSSMFNNDADSVRLIDNNGALMDRLQYTSSVKGKTIGRSQSDQSIFCLQEPSKNQPNNVCIQPSLSPAPSVTMSENTPTPTRLPSPTRTPTPAKYSTYSGLMVTVTPSPKVAVLGTTVKKSVTSNSSASSTSGDLQDSKSQIIVDDTGSPNSYFWLLSFPLASILFSLLASGVILLRIKLNLDPYPSTSVITA